MNYITDVDQVNQNWLLFYGNLQRFKIYFYCCFDRLKLLQWIELSQLNYFLYVKFHQLYLIIQILANIGFSWQINNT